MDENRKGFLQVCEYLPAGLRLTIKKIPQFMQDSLHEIRLRAEKPVCLFDGKNSYLLNRDGTVSTENGRAYCISKRELDETFKLLCEYSVHSFQEEIRQGFITLRGGHRAGICGTCLLDQGRVTGVKEISSVNLRIARQMMGVADELYQKLFLDGLHSVLIVGQAGSGKTTLLRDLIRQLSEGRAGRSYKISVVDERGELAAVWRGVSQNQLGKNTDVYHLYPKHIGMSMAIRTLSPQVIACDEIGSEDDILALLQSMNAGVSVLATVHGSSLEDVNNRGKIASVLSEGVFDFAVILKGTGCPGEVKEIVRLAENRFGR